jgi:hypothetical protein
MLSQVYMTTTFTQRINTVLSADVRKEMRDGDVVRTGELIKIMDGFPVSCVCYVDVDVSWVS